MNDTREWFVMLQDRRGLVIHGPFRRVTGRNGDSGSGEHLARAFASSQPEKAAARVLGPFSPYRIAERRRRRTMAEAKTPNNPAMIEHFLRELEHPAKMLSRWEQDFLYSAKDQYERRGRLSPKQFDVLERIYAERTA